MMYTHNVQKAFILVAVAAVVTLATLACMVLLAPHQIHPWQGLGAVPSIIYPHS